MCSVMLRFVTTNVKIIQNFQTAKLCSLALGVRLVQSGRNSHFALKPSLKSKVQNTSPFIINTNTSCFPKQNFSCFKNSGKTPQVFECVNFQSASGMICSLNLRNDWNSTCTTYKKKSTNLEFFLTNSVVRYSCNTSENRQHGKTDNFWKKQSKYGGMTYILAVMVTLGSAVYIVRKVKNDLSPSESVCQAAAADSRNTLNRPKIPTPSLQEAISQATDLCQRIKDESGSPGLVVAVSVNGQLLWSKALGYSDVENRLPCKPDTVMRIASISKPITMAAVAKAMERGELDLDKPVQAYVPQFPEKTVNGEKVVITTRQLVSHLGGIRSYNKKYMTDSKKGNSSSGTESRTTTESSEEKNPAAALKVFGEFKMREYYIKKNFDSTEGALTLFKDDPLVHKPGTKYLYTTHGWTLIAAVLEGATKSKFPELIRKLFQDLGLENTYLDDNVPLIYNRSRFYAKNKKGHLVNAPYVDCSYKYAGGGLLSTAPDLVRFGNAMLYSYQQTTTEQQNSVTSPTKTDGKQETRDNKQLLPEGAQYSDSHSGRGCQDSLPVPSYLKPETVQEIWAPVQGTNSDKHIGKFYAMGWEVAPEEQTVGFGRKQRFYVAHSGGAVGASSVLLILPSLEESSRGNNLKSEPPRGVVVVIIVNLINVSLSTTALAIAKLFENVSLD